MKKKIIGSVVISIIALSLIFIVYFVKKNTNEIEKKDLNKDFIKMTIVSNENNYPENYTFDNYEDLIMHFPDAKVSKDEFNENKFLLIGIEYDSCGEKNITPVNYTIKNNKVIVNVQYENTCGGPCAPECMYYLLKIKRSQTIDNVDFEYENLSTERCHDYPYVVKKPIIYLYPEEETNVTVKVAYEEKLTTTYPKYNGGWNVTAYPDGTLIDNNTNRQLYGLYWEGKDNNIKQTNEGFVIAGEDTSEFLEEKLNILGLTDKEAEEFIIYWLPILEKNKYNYIRFSSQEEINKYMPLEVNPTPDTIIRVVMNYKPLDRKINVKEQKLERKERKGFTLVEWGGSQIKD